MKTTGTNPDIDILFEDNHLLAVDKPAGLLSQADFSGNTDLLSVCKDYLRNTYNKQGNIFLGLLHRLDRPVGGVMVFAKTSKAAARISSQIKKREVRKTYFAIVHGHPPNNGFFQHSLVKEKKRNLVSVTHKNDKNGKLAELTFQKVDQIEDLALLQISLITGRPHQIRVQFSHEGFAVYGDSRYGPDTGKEIALFAARLTLAHPTLNKPITLSATIPSKHPWKLFSHSL